VVLAFAMANSTAAFQPKVPISTVRSEFPNAKVMIAIGGWGDTIGFSDATASPTGIDRLAQDVQTMLQNTGADGIDIDWEYPGGNGADYKQVPNDQKVSEIAAFPELLKAVRNKIGNDKLLSIAVPGKKGDMIAYTKENGPKIWPSVDYINVMSYDLMNRRDTHTAHHTSVEGTKEAIQNYLDIGAPPEKINLGFAFYAKYFTTAGDCSTSSTPLGCEIVAAEDPSGADTLTSGAWTFEKSHLEPVNVRALSVSYDGTCGPEKMSKCASGCCSQYGNCGTTKEHCSGACQHAFGTGCTDPDIFGSWQKASANGEADEQAGAQYYFDRENKLFWTWDTPELITRKFREIVEPLKLGGVMAWSLGEDSYDWSHIRQISAELGKGGYGSYEPATENPSQDHTDVNAPENPPQDDTDVSGEAPADEPCYPDPEDPSICWVDVWVDAPQQ
jgi:chitinase